ncbi:MAG: WD40 repeat domain-containing protein [Leptolyngbyaceae cyanobacterium bins.302]|nr:WD40 repeat domain-containing protein [Leptolyngbyaceae cyanobacterium bins.302]
MVATGKPQEFQQIWQERFADYITAIAWLPEGQALAISSAAGEVALISLASGAIQSLQTATGSSVDCLAVSQDGQFLATGGQNGQVKIWRLNASPPELLTTLENPSVWVDRLAWSPTTNQLAFGLGRYAQVWDAEADAIVTTLNFESSSVLGIDWHPSGSFLALCGHKGARVWNANDWDEDPQVLEIPSASVAIAWSPNGTYLADGNLDNTLTVVEWTRPHNPWVMQGFPGKVRHLAWSQRLTPTGAPLLATSSSETIVIWERDADESVGWANQVLNDHEGIVQAIAFQPNSFLLASAADDGFVVLWQAAQQPVQVLEGASGFSCLSWESGGNFLAAGGREGDIVIWQQR